MTAYFITVISQSQAFPDATLNTPDLMYLYFNWEDYVDEIWTSPELRFALSGNQEKPRNPMNGVRFQVEQVWWVIVELYSSEHALLW